jgi:hypothetical protein
MKRPTRSLRPDPIDLVLPTQEDFQLDLTERVRGAVQPDFDGNRCSRGTRVERFRVVIPREGRKIPGTRPGTN